MEESSRESETEESEEEEKYRRQPYSGGQRKPCSGLGANLELPEETQD